MKYTVLVKPNSKKGPLVVEDTAAKTLTIYLREKPVDGEANQALIKVLAKHFRVAKSQIIIKTGAASRHKVIEIIDFEH